MDSTSIIKLLGSMVLSLLIVWLIAGGLIYLLILFGRRLIGKKDTWKDTAKQLGLGIPDDRGLALMPMEGIYDGFQVRIINNRIPDDLYITCEVYLPTKSNFSFNIEAAGSIMQAISSAFGKGGIEVGVPGFDKSFSVNSTDENKIGELLAVDLENGRTPNLIADLLLINKSFSQVKITDSLVYLRKEEEMVEASAIESLLESAIYLAKRINSARKKLEKDFS